MFKKLFLFIFIVLLLFGSFKAGAYSARKKPIREGVVSSKKESIDFTKFWKTWDLVHKKFVGEINDQALLDGAVQGMVSSLDDPYTVFLDSKETSDFNKDIEGSLEGIGAEVGIKKGRLVIIAPLPGSPAEKTGLLAGDQILKIGDKDVDGLSFEEAIREIRGLKGTKVKLIILRGIGTQKTFIITRDTITIDSVTWKFEKDVAVIKITRFGEDTAEKLREASQDALSKGVTGIVLDLRNNPGGYLDSAIDVASIFLQSKTVVIEQSKDGKQTKFNSKGKALFSSLPLVVLINSGSASASEIVAGAILDNNRGTIIGETSFGKGSVQTIEVLDDGSTVHITIAKWLTPKGISISEKGIKPDIVIKVKENEYLTGDDVQLDKALELLSK